jgi:hypothetical protein
MPRTNIAIDGPSFKEPNYAPRSPQLFFTTAGFLTLIA